MPNGWDLGGKFREGRKGARAGELLSMVGLVITMLAWIWYGLVGLAWVSILQGIILVVSVRSLGSQVSAIYIAFRGTRDDSDFTERTRLGNGTYDEIKRLWSEAFSVQQRIAQIAGQTE